MKDPFAEPDYAESERIHRQFGQPQFVKEFKERAGPLMTAIRANPQGLKGCLQAYYDLGVLANEKMSDGAVHGAKTEDKFAKSIGQHRSWLSTVRMFSRVYNTQQLEDLCKRADHLNWAHVACLIRIQPDSRRAEFQRRAAEEKWSVARLRREVQDKQPAPKRGGRKIKAPGSLKDALESIIQNSERWRKHCRAAIKEMGADPKAMADQDTKDLAAKAIELLGQVARTAHAAIEKLKVN